MTRKAEAEVVGGGREACSCTLSRLLLPLSRLLVQGVVTRRVCTAEEAALNGRPKRQPHRAAGSCRSPVG